MRKSRVTLIFAAAGLVGPLVWLAAWPPARLADVLPRPVWFFYTDLVEILWPVSMMGPWIGVPVNLLLFTVLGLVVAWLAQTRSRLAIAYAVVTILIFVMALWQAGFVFPRLDGFALAVALVLYAIPFWIVMRASAMPRSV
jgi:hypothetical protein